MSELPAQFARLAVPLRRVGIFLLPALSIPWLLVTPYLASSFWPYALGLRSPHALLSRYSGLFDTYLALDGLLPEDAVLLIGRSRSSMVQAARYSRPVTFYAPRRVVHHGRDPGAEDVTHLVYIVPDPEPEPVPVDPWLPPGVSMGHLVYDEPGARFYVSRGPRGGGYAARVRVYQLQRPQPSEPASEAGEARAK